MTEKFYSKDAEEGEKQDLGVYEARRLIGPLSYDDEWKLARYTAELRKEKDDGFYAFVDFEGDEGSIRECPHCLEYGFHNKLGPKIKKKNEPPAPDDYQWCSCFECGNTFAVYQTFPESEIKDSLETVSNPFEESASVFMSVGKRKLKDHRLNKFLDSDPDIAEEIRKHGSNNVHIIQ